MRISPFFAVVGIAVLTSCSSPTDVLVTQSDDHNSTRSTEAPASSVVDTAPPPTTTDFDAASLLLTASDLPDWGVTAPMKVPEEPTWEALDCQDMNVAWSATGRGGSRSRGSTDGIAFRNTVVEFDSTDDAAAVLDAVDRVWMDCILINTELDTFWSEPFDAPTSQHRMAGLVLGGDSISAWALGFWQVDHAIVVLEVNGDEVWTHLDQLFATMSARVDGVPVPPTTSTIQTTIPGQRPTNSTAPVSTTPPSSSTAPNSTTAPDPGAFPPADADWSDHRLAALVPSPDEIGDGWAFDYGYTNSAEPADPDDAIPGCETPVPPTLDGLSLSYSRDAPESGTEIELGEGSAEDAQVLIDAVRAIAGCDLDEIGLAAEYQLSDLRIDGVDDSVILTGRVDDGSDEVNQVIAVARVDGLSVAIFYGADSEVALVEAEAEVVDLITLVLAKR